MFGICIESSHQRGMGHLFRAINMIDYLKKHNEEYIVFLNNDEKSVHILEQKNILCEIVDLNDYISNWESKMIQKHKIHIWINDRLNTDIRSARNVINLNTDLYTFDDCGNGAAVSKANFAGMVFDDTVILEGKNVFRGKEYIVLNSEIVKYQRIRESDKKIIVSMGGSDTYGVTRKIIEILKKINKPADIIIGPGAEKDMLFDILDERYTLKRFVPSLIEEFYNYDLAITGGGITCFEANASGLPCIIVANELHEIQIGKYLERIGTSVFAGYHLDLNYHVFNQYLDIKNMSEAGMKHIKTDGADKIYNIMTGGEKVER